MKQEEFEIQVMEYLKGTLAEDKRKVFEDFLEKDTRAKKQVEELTAIWDAFGKSQIPEPSAQMDEQFFELLDMEITRTTKKTSSWSKEVMALLKVVFRPQLAYGIIILGLGLLAGYLIKSGDSETNVPIETVEISDNQELREKLVLTLLEQSSANQRLQGVSEASKIVRVDEQVINALLKTLNNDPNVNVRLAAIESLSNYVDNALVRQGIIQSIPNQESPIIQVTLANLMLALEEKGSIASFKKLLEKEELDSTVKKKIENTIASII
ncbi:MAG: HEAT repeat domain-containing protein [Bacteroidota bacterium]